jgi:hypothetical protein
MESLLPASRDLAVLCVAASRSPARRHTTSSHALLPLWVGANRMAAANHRTAQIPGGGDNCRMAQLPWRWAASGRPARCAYWAERDWTGMGSESTILPFKFILKIILCSYILVLDLYISGFDPRLKFLYISSFYFIAIWSIQMDGYSFFPSTVKFHIQLDIHFISVTMDAWPGLIVLRPFAIV